MTKKIIGGFEMATSVEHWSSTKEQKTEKEMAGEKVMWGSSLQKDGQRQKRIVWERREIADAF